ncbi:aminoglycoside phosphotransferase family protein [Microbacterium gorillae]|uniref:aminoglycoside phosphotransferase family protein n=1 Tax=Microbacterium gorillae TaxID=1231063 RepID=UPI000AF24A11|nr:aminoglycoside phosphotransferase family protein [Microbacterium gorillae]
MTSPAPTVDTVVSLLHGQAPDLADRPVRGLAASGSSNVVFRLGEDLAVRLPRSDRYVPDLRNEVRWLPVLAPHLPTTIPEVVVEGRPTEAFPRPWTIVSWVSGDLPLELDAAQQVRLAETLGAFLRSLHAIDATGVPSGPDEWGYRCGEPVTEESDRWVAEAAAELADVFDPARVHEAWRRLRCVPPASAGPSCVHTDLSVENLLVDADGALSGVIDFGGVGVGDPSVDLQYAWSMFDAPAREVFRSAAGADEATWARARAWAFGGPGLSTLAGYRHSMPERTARLTRMVEAVAAEVGIRLR